MLAALLLTTGCATAKLVGPNPIVPPDPGERRVVVLEPFFESAEWRTTVKTEHASLVGPYGRPQDVVIQRQVVEKPLYARVQSLAAEHQAVLAEVQKLRPSWQVTSTGGMSALSGPVTVVRTIVGEMEVVESNRALKNLACGFGVVIWPLLLFNLSPVRETHRVYGVLERFDAEADSLRPRLLRYPTQPDFAVDTRGLEPLRRSYGLDLTFEEGVLASEAEREPVLLGGFAQRLAAAVIAIVEEDR